MARLAASVRRLLFDVSGHATVEYLFMMFLVIFACLTGIAAIGSQTLALFVRSLNAMP